MKSRSRTILLAGGSGLVGRHLTERLLAEGWQPILLTRRPTMPSLPSGVPTQGWDRIGPALEGAAALINLAGANIGHRRWTKAYKAVLWSSRIESTRRLIDALKACQNRPPVFIQASATGYYGHRTPPALSEEAPPGTGFLADLCRAWESEALQAEALGIRVVLPRMGVVLTPHGGAFPRMVRPLRAGFGIILGDGRQGFPWIHLEDLGSLILRMIEDPTWTGPIHATAPDVLDHATFQRALAQRLHRPLWPVPAPVSRALLKLFLGEMAETLLLQGAFVHPTRALASGFTFQFPTLAEALEDLLGAS